MLRGEPRYRPSGRMIMQVILLASLLAFAAGTATAAAAAAAASLSMETTSNKALQASPSAPLARWTRLVSTQLNGAVNALACTQRRTDVTRSNDIDMAHDLIALYKSVYYYYYYYVQKITSSRHP